MASRISRRHIPWLASAPDLRHLRAPRVLPRQRSTKTGRCWHNFPPDKPLPTYPISCRTSFDQNDSSLGVRAFHRQMQRRIADSILSVQSSLCLDVRAWRRTDEKADKTGVSDGCGPMERMLVRLVFRVNLDGGRSVSESKPASDWVALTSAPRSMRRRPI